MAEKTLNVFSKLALARVKFLERKVKKSGWNGHLEFHYYTLDDIAPIQSEIFNELGLIEIFTYEPERIGHRGEEVWTQPPTAQSTVINADNPGETITFVSHWTEAGAIGRATNALQQYGTAQTYLRRYNKMQILDLAEPDVVDSEKTTKIEEKKTVKVASNKRETAKNTLTGSDKQADDTLIEQVKNTVLKLKKEFTGVKEFDAWIKDVPGPKALEKITNKQAQDLIAGAAALREKLLKETE